MQKWTWKKFYKYARSSDCAMLARLSDFPGAILVGGCQRSGTTLMARLIRRDSDMEIFNITKDDELDAALILSGLHQYKANKRVCFQTTYINECFYEYKQIERSQKIIWVIRNPYSVVWSMLYNWRRSALELLFEGCGREYLSSRESLIYNIIPRFSVSGIKKACLAYRSRLKEVAEITQWLPKDQLMLVDYDDFLKSPENEMNEICRFSGINYSQNLVSDVNPISKTKADRLSQSQRRLITELAMPEYDRARKIMDEMKKCQA